MRSHVAFGDKKSRKVPCVARTSDPRSINDKTGCHPPPFPVLQTTQGVSMEHTPATPGQAMGVVASPPILGSRARLLCFHFQILISFLGSVYIFCTETFLWFIYLEYSHGTQFVSAASRRMIWFATSRFRFISQLTLLAWQSFCWVLSFCPASLNNEAGLN